MKNALLILALLLIPAFGWALSPQTLIKGQATTVTVDYEIGDVAIADQDVCDLVVQENRREIYLNPKKDGKTSITLWDVNGIKQDSVPVNVISVGLNEILEDAKSAFEGAGALKFSIEGAQVVIRGEVATAQDLARIQAFSAQFPQVKNETSMAKAVLETISAEIEKAIATPGIRVRSIRDKLVLEGTAYSQEASARAEKIAKLYDENVINLIFVKDTKRNVGAEKLVQLEIQFMEIKKNAIRSFGINWAPGSTAGGGGGGNASIGGGSAGADFMGIGGMANSIIGFVFNLAPKIKFARQKGDARVLENPSLVVKSGETGDFFSGTQVPFYSQQAVVFKDIGVKIQAEPIASAEDVDLKINITVTSPTAGGVNKGIDTNTVSTTAYCKAGSSLALGGIYRNSDAKTYNRIPEDINTASALFTLFLSKDFISNRSEFVIFVTPKIVDQPTKQMGTNTLSLNDWDEVNENIIKKRSVKEYKDYVKEKYGNEKLWENYKSKGSAKRPPKLQAMAMPVQEKEVTEAQPVVEQPQEQVEIKVKEQKTEMKEEPVFELPESLKN